MNIPQYPIKWNTGIYQNIIPVDTPVYGENILWNRFLHKPEIDFTNIFPSVVARVSNNKRCFDFIIFSEGVKWFFL